MIWFSCPKCQKVHGRPDNACGAMIFCTCGHGLTVPWESTAPEPMHPPAAAAPETARVEPLSFGASVPPPERELTPAPRLGRRGARFHYDPNFCFNHDSRPKQKICDDCGLSFCDDCAVGFRGQTLCGPCKNYEAKLLQRPTRTSPYSLTSLLVALAGGPMMFCLLSMSASRGYYVFTLLALAPQVLAFVAGVLGLRAAHGNPRIGGQGIAITGMATACFTAVLTVALTWYGMRLS